MYKNDRREGGGAGGVQKSFTRTDPDSLAFNNYFRLRNIFETTRPFKTLYIVSLCVRELCNKPL